MMEIWIERIVPGLVRLVLFVAIGVFTGSLLESSGWIRKLTFLAKPYCFLGNLPPLCGASFLTAFISVRAASSMLAGAESDQTISKKDMIIGAIANIFPNIISHIKISAFFIIPLLGYVGIAYVSFQILLGLTCTITALLLGRLLNHQSEVQPGYAGGLENIEKYNPKKVLQKAWERTQTILIRVSLISAPLYIGIVLLDAQDFFTKMATKMPSLIQDILPPASLVIVASHMTNMHTAAAAASGFLESGTLTSMQVFLVLLISYGLTIPLRSLRHNIPSAIGIFPPREGLYIVFFSQSLRFIYTLITVLTLLTFF